MAKVDAVNGLLAGPKTKKSFLLPFKAGTQPVRISKGQSSSSDGSGGESSGRTNRDEDMLKSLF
jgi:penicillin-binding protein 1A